MKREREHVVDFVFVLSLLCVFTVCGLLIVFIGIHVYKGTVTHMQEAFSNRTAMSFVVKQVRQHNRLDAITIGDVEGATALVMLEDVGEEVFCKYIYYYDGYLRELYAKESYEPVRAAGQALIAIDGFEAEIVEQGILRIEVEDDERGSEELILALVGSSFYE